MTAVLENPALPRSILDTDLYKLTMQQAVLQHFPDVQATYRFTNRSKATQFSRRCVEKVRASVALFADLALTPSEREWLNLKCPWFSTDYLDYLSAFRFKPEQVSITFIPSSEDLSAGQVKIEATGPWVEAILWEVPLMATLSETYFQTDDTDWNYDGQEELAFQKGKTLLEAGCSLSEFGTRRRRSFHGQDLVVKSLVRASEEITKTRGRLGGTSNVHLAHKYNLAPIGTIAHEWFMGIGALRGYKHVNDIALQLWEETYPNTPGLLTALTDTFSTQAFFKEITQNPARARRWTGLRQDSGDPFIFVSRVKELYERLGIDYREKLMVFSDALTVDKALKIQELCNELGFKKVSFGIGTFLTNDFKTLSSGSTEKSKALNIVIKLGSVNNLPCVKISDDLTKNTGDKDVVAHVKQVFNLEK
ncbi:putative nicotinate phosphoribosyltransferase [Leucoagaricus sp. SymC.cos]|nr:putative nicotinate phosphoribosyltransferase [Leucoagaricus sp. SymC.cos]